VVVVLFVLVEHQRVDNTLRDYIHLVFEVIAVAVAVAIAVIVVVERDYSRQDCMVQAVVVVQVVEVVHKH